MIEELIRTLAQAALDADGGKVAIAFNPKGEWKVSGVGPNGKYKHARPDLETALHLAADDSKKAQ